ncbi:MAG: ATP-binding cassette domain-containing protein [Rhodospirillales bacterium]|nr:ATP-binding cassette domain-containing protein [Rhodospirillales bacterium]
MNSPPATAVAFDDVRLAPGGFAVLENARFAIPEGALVGLIGPNGTGKTTLLRAILGLEAPRAGRIAVLGGPARRGNPAIGYLPQRAVTAGPRLSGRAMVGAALAGHRFGLACAFPGRGGAAQAEIDRVLDLAGATDFADRPMGALSGGQRQSLMLAAALLGRPRLLLLDEPLAGLDPLRQAEVVAAIARLHARLGIGVILSSHDLNPLLGTIGQVLYLGRGHAVLGTVDQVVTGPVLSDLFGAKIEVLRIAGRILVLAPDGTMLDGADARL